MCIVLSILHLILLIGLGFASLSGLGWLAVGPLVHGSLTGRGQETSWLEEIPLILTWGLILNFGILLLVRSLTAAEVIVGIAALCGMTCFSRHVLLALGARPVRRGNIMAYIGAIVVCLTFLGPIAAQPLIAWDARSIWFFHAKMIYVAGALDSSAGWQDPSVAFSFAYYPALMPALAAEIVHVAGAWNEYLPKLCLFFILAPSTAWLFTFARRSLSFVLLALFPYSLSALLWNGYMDGYLAFYFLIAMLLLGRYMRSSRPFDLISGLSCLCLLLYIKNEGALAILAGLGSISLITLLRKVPYSMHRAFSLKSKYYAGALISLLPFAIWEVQKQVWGLDNPYGIGVVESLARIYGRLSDGSYRLILQSAYVQIDGVLMLLGFSVLAAVILRAPHGAMESLPALIATAIYCFALIVIYLLTPYELAWQLGTSIQRTMLPVSAGILTSSFYVLEGIHRSESEFEASREGRAPS